MIRSSRDATVLATALFTLSIAAPAQKLPNLFPFPNSNGLLATFDTSGSVDLSGPFFQSLGTNGRSCASCHQPGDAWSVSAQNIRLRFEFTRGQDPIFRPVDGSNCNHNVDVSTVAGRRDAYSLLLKKGLIRIALPVPASAEFEVIGVSNPYGCNESSPLSIYRRPLPTANLRFLSTLMWDGRESSLQTGATPITSTSYPQALVEDLGRQSLDATSGHAEAAAPLTREQQQQIVAFEIDLFTAQVVDFGAGDLNSRGARGGPVSLATQPFFIGVNDPLGLNPSGAPFSPVIFTTFDAWELSQNQNENRHRASIARGQVLFNSKPIRIEGVGGLNDATGMNTVVGTCGTCHDTPNVGNHSVSAPLNIGIAELTNPLGVPDLPVITLRNKTTGEIVRTTDPGRALITGRWQDISKFKGPILRGLSGRAPYFHNGSADNLSDVIEFYNKRFLMNLSDQEKADLRAFLSVL